MNINHLPDDDLRCILLHFPLQQLLQLRLVCSHWQAIIEEICAAKRSLKIFASIGNVVTYVRTLADFHLVEEAAFALKDIGADDDLLETQQADPPNRNQQRQPPQQAEEQERTAAHRVLSWSRSRPPQRRSSSLQLSRPSAERVHSKPADQLLSTFLLQEEHIFPKVEHLTFFKHSFNCHFAAFRRLSSLTLNCQFVSGFTGCLRQLSKLSTLNSLHLFRVGFELSEAIRHVPASAQLVFGRLAELSICGSFDHSAISVSFLRLLGPAARKLTVKLPTINFEEFAALCEKTVASVEDAEASSSTSATTTSTFAPHLLTSLSLDGLVDAELPFGRQIALHCRFIDTICSHFSGLQHLQLGLMREVTHHQVAPSLARLTQLKSLSLLRHFWVTENISQPSATGVPVAGTLPTVRTVHLICSSSSSFNYSSLSKFSLIFPGLTALQVSAEEETLAKFKHHLGMRMSKDEQQQQQHQQQQHSTSSRGSALSPSVEIRYSRLKDTIDYLGRHQTAYRRYIDELVAQIAEILRTWFRAKRSRGPSHPLLFFFFKLLFFFLGFMVAIILKYIFW